MGISAKQMLTRLQQVKNQTWIKTQVQEIVTKDQQELKKEKINEFKRGELPNKDIIGVYRNPFYAKRKFSMNPLAGGTVDLILTGSFTNKLFLEKTERGFLFNSTDNKTELLQQKYGTEIMGLNQQWFNERQQKVYKDLLIKEIKKILNA